MIRLENSLQIVFPLELSIFPSVLATNLTNIITSTRPQNSITMLVSENMLKPLFHFPVKT